MHTPVGKLAVPYSRVTAEELPSTGGRVRDAITIAVVELAAVWLGGIPLFHVRKPFRNHR